MKYNASRLADEIMRRIDGPGARRRGPRRVFAACLLALLAVPGLASAVEAPRQVTIFAAASTTDVLRDAIARFEAGSGGLRVKAVFAASSTLAKQVAEGAPADLVLLASADWMDHLAAQGVLAPGSRVDLLGNGLVVIAPVEGEPAAGREPGAGTGAGELVAARLAAGYLAIGDPAHVPAGIYAKAALETLGLWESLADRTLRAANVRAAVALVERGEAAAGIVYRSDARAFADRVRPIAELPPDSHPPVVYPLALVAPSTPAGEALHRFLTGPEAAALFRRHGFDPLGRS